MIIFFVNIFIESSKDDDKESNETSNANENSQMDIDTTEGIIFLPILFF
jgi:hypothetical protein